MRTCPKPDCGVSVADESLRYCPDCSESLEGDIDLEGLPVQRAQLGEDLLGGLPQAPMAGSTGPIAAIPPVVDSPPVSLTASPSGTVLSPAAPVPPMPMAELPPVRLPSGSGWVRGPFEAPITSRPVGVAEPALGFAGGVPQYSTRPVRMPELDETIGFAIDHGTEFQVGAAGSLFVRFERTPTPRRLDLHLRWEVEVDGQRREGATHAVWHGDDYDQDAVYGVTPQRSGELRLIRLSVAIVPEGEVAKALVYAVRDLPVAFRVKDAPATGTVHNHITVQGSGNALMLKGEQPNSIHVQGTGNALSIDANSASGAPTNTPAFELARRRLVPNQLVKEPRPEWWLRRKHVLRTAYSHRAVLTWSTPAGPRVLVVCQRPSWFHFGRSKDANQIVLRWSPCRDGVDDENVMRTRCISRAHLALEVASAQVSLQRLSANTFVPKAISRPNFGPGAGTAERSACEPMRPERISISKSEIVHVGSACGDGSDGLQLRFTPLSNPGYSAVLVERLNNRPNLAYLCMVSSTKLGGAGCFQGLPRELVLECVNDCIELQGPAGVDLAANDIELRACNEDEFAD